MTQEIKSPVNPAPKPVADHMGLGRTSGQRSAEMVAGLRYELNPSTITNALSRMMGRVIARSLLAMVGNSRRSQFNFITARSAVFSKLAKDNLPKDGILAEIAAGFNPRGIQIALDMPTVKVIEVDLPDVVREKEQRLRRSREVTVPDNIHWEAADLSNTALSVPLHDQKVNVVTAEGLNPYFTPADITRIAKHIRECLAPGGVYISDVGLQTGRQSIDGSATRYFSRQAGTFLGIVDDPEAGRKLLLDAGYPRAEVYLCSQMAEELKLPTPVVDVACIVVGYA
jgi:O-methyltransferase involved in polyketide biosynthesis